MGAVSLALRVDFMFIQVTYRNPVGVFVFSEILGNFQTDP